MCSAICRRVFALVAAVVAATAIAVGTCPAWAGATPTLGVSNPSQGAASSGFGVAHPSEISYGGDDTSFVRKVHWQSWGGAEARGTGVATWVWPGWNDESGAVQLKADVVATNLRDCGGQRVYESVTWYFPSRGETFEKRYARPNVELCPTVKPTTFGTSRFGKCSGPATNDAGFSYNDQSYDLEDVDATGLTCAAARRFIEAHPSLTAESYYRSYRRHVGDWWCGSEKGMEIVGGPGVTCIKGNDTYVDWQSAEGGD